MRCIDNVCIYLESTVDLLTVWMVQKSDVENPRFFDGCIKASPRGIKQPSSTRPDCRSNRSIDLLI